MRILLTGGGTGGHIFPNIAIVEEASKRADSDYQFLYLGEKNSLEEALIRKKNISFRGIFCGKLRRYFDFKNVIDFFKVPIGFGQAAYHIWRFKPDIVFSKGGYVSVPVVAAAFFLRKKIITHDSDAIPGLATRINARFANIICLNYPEAKKFFTGKRVEITGIPTPLANLKGDQKIAYKLTGFQENLPVLLILGGSLGAKRINKVVFLILPELLKELQIIHITGSGKGEKVHLDADLRGRYFQIPFTNQIGDLYSITDLAVSRAGAGVIAELTNFHIPMILIPLSKNASRGDQIVNAKIHAKRKEALLLNEEELTAKTLLDAIKEALRRPATKRNRSAMMHREAAAKILTLMKNL